ncbi:hypothetical protein AURDEDRAFT_131217 [Auricularia subglabra TFB-10046 SS5]|uniref:SMP domain-containing protein n=1 Tax=Auricularia subglabra (strain TFB-10046 / SS5) TaxID=717982 RepID=J0D657_AURST|nr:hypothetical protein AURDEDRAFT_131217 [Auricularia subglabra TFB-10046 SS5]
MSATRQTGISSSFSGARAGIDLAQVNAREAARLMSEEHKMLSYRPPAGSLAAQAQAAAAKHPDAPGAVGGDMRELRRLAQDDVARIQAERGSGNRTGNRKGRSVGVQTGNQGAEVGVAGVASSAAVSKIQSVEHKALGYRPPKDSLAADAQRAAVKNPDADGNVDATVLAGVTVQDVERIVGEHAKA